MPPLLCQDEAFSTCQLVDADGAGDVEAPGCEQRLKRELDIRRQRGLREIRVRQPQRFQCSERSDGRNPRCSSAASLRKRLAGW